MDPLSMTTSIMAIAEAGTSLGKLIWDTCDNFRSARSDMQDMAEEVDLITSLFVGLGASMRRAPDLYSAEFRRSAKNLIAKCHKLFVEIRDMFPDDVDERGSFGRQYEKMVWATFTKDRILKRQTELRQMQHMFSFMETMQRYIERPQQHDQINTTITGGAPNVGAGGVPQQTPIQLSGSVPGQGPISATLTFQSAPATETYADVVEPPPYDVEEAKQRDKTRLQNMRMSPYFSKALLDESETPAVGIEPRVGQPVHFSEPMPVATTYDEVITIEPEEAQPDDSEGKKPEKFVAKPEPVAVEPEVSEEQARAPPTRNEAAASVDDLIAGWTKLPVQKNQPVNAQPDQATVIEVPAAQNDHLQQAEDLPASGLQFQSVTEPQKQTQAETFTIPERIPGARIIESRSSDHTTSSLQQNYQEALGTQDNADSSPQLQRRRAYSLTCNGCREGIEGVRHKCRECPDFNYCGQCYKYPPLRHLHPMSEFVQIR